MFCYALLLTVVVGCLMEFGGEDTIVVGVVGECFCGEHECAEVEVHV